MPHPCSLAAQDISLSLAPFADSIAAQCSNPNGGTWSYTAYYAADLADLADLSDGSKVKACKAGDGAANALFTCSGLAPKTTYAVACKATPALGGDAKAKVAKASATT